MHTTTSAFPSDAVKHYGFSTLHVLTGLTLVGALMSTTITHGLRSISNGDQVFTSQHMRAEEAARQRLATLRKVDFMSIGAGEEVTQPPYLGYSEANRQHPGFTPGEDHYLADQVDLGGGVVGSRTVVVKNGDSNDVKKFEIIVTWIHDGMPRSMLKRALLRRGGNEADHA